MSTTRRLVAYHVGRLQDPNPQVRLKAIQELKLLCDPESLEALQSVFQTDPNGEVRKAAQDAGRAIFLQKQKNKPT